MHLFVSFRFVSFRTVGWAWSWFSASALHMLILAGLAMAQMLHQGFNVFKSVTFWGLIITYE